MNEREVMKRWQKQHEVDAIFHACLLELGLPRLYLHTEEGRETDYKRQQIGVRIEQAYNLGRKHADKEHNERFMKEMADKWQDVPTVREE